MALGALRAIAAPSEADYLFAGAIAAGASAGTAMRQSVVG